MNASMMGKGRAVLGRVRSAIRRVGAPSARDPFQCQRKFIGAAQPTIFDVGAHTGSVARKYRALFPWAAIHCFEPFGASFEQLSARMGGDTNIHLHPVAVSNARGKLRFHSNRAPVTNSLLPTHPLAPTSWGDGLIETEATLEVDSTTLDDFCKENAIPAVDILKLDIQGAEFMALQGARGMLSAQAIGLIYTEIILVPTYEGQHMFSEYLSFLAGLGYDLVDFYNPLHQGVRLTQIDALFISRALAGQAV